MDSDDSDSEDTVDYIGTPVIADPAFVRWLEAEEGAPVAVPDGSCAVCRRPPLGSTHDNSLVNCDICGRNTCRQCIASSIRIQLRDGRTPEALRCDNCGSRSPVLEALQEIRPRRFPRIWSTRKCPVCRTRSHKISGERQVQCTNCSFRFCAWCKKPFSSAPHSSRRNEEASTSCVCRKTEKAALCVVKTGAIVLIIPLFTVSLLLSGAAFGLMYVISNSEEKAGYKRDLGEIFS